MARNLRVFLLVACAMALAAACFEGTQSIARAEIALESSTFSLGELVLRDDFSDNQRGLLWNAYVEDPNTCWVEEINQRLELRATDQADDDWAGYIADSWRLNPQDDFAMKIDFHYDLKTWDRGGVNIGITPSPTNLDDRRVTIGVGCVDRFAYYWFEKKHDLSINSSYYWRGDTNGSLYIYYTAANDTLYIGVAGYEPDDAWQTFEGLLQGSWGGDPVYVYFGGFSVELAIGSGPAYLDNLLVEAGTVIEAALQEVYRFWSPAQGTHFYTMSEAEKEKLLTQYPKVWVYEGVAYHAYPDATDSNARPVYRFWSPTLFTHFYTISRDERDKLIDKFSAVWAYEGVAFHAFPVGGEPDWAKPVYRFWSAVNETHFYTISESERDKLLADPATWIYEDIAWYAGE